MTVHQTWSPKKCQAVITLTCKRFYEFITRFPICGFTATAIICHEDDYIWILRLRSFTPTKEERNWFRLFAAFSHLVHQAVSLKRLVSLALFLLVLAHKLCLCQGFSYSNIGTSFCQLVLSEKFADQLSRCLTIAIHTLAPYLFHLAHDDHSNDIQTNLCTLRTDESIYFFWLNCLSQHN